MTRKRQGQSEALFTAGFRRTFALFGGTFWLKVDFFQDALPKGRRPFLRFAQPMNKVRLTEGHSWQAGNGAIGVGWQVHFQANTNNHWRFAHALV
jgi:hypothetical protein